MNTTLPIGPLASYGITMTIGRRLRRLVTRHNTPTKFSSMLYTGSLHRERDGTVNATGHLDLINWNGQDTSRLAVGLPFIRRVYRRVISSYHLIPTQYKPYVHSITWTVAIRWDNGTRKNTPKESSGSQVSTTSVKN